MKYLIKFSLFGSILLIGAVFFSSCLGNKHASGSDQSCEYAATIRDFTGLDGCKLLFELENGDLLLAGEWKMEQPALTDGGQVRISYEIMEGMASICMREKYIVRITCFEYVRE